MGEGELREVLKRHCEAKKTAEAAKEAAAAHGQAGRRWAYRDHQTRHPPTAPWVRADRASSTPAGVTSTTDISSNKRAALSHRV